jgi:hypothetical protein
MKTGHCPAERPPTAYGRSGGNGQLAVIAAWAVLILSAAWSEQAQAAGQTAKEGHTQSSPVLEQPVIRGSRTPAAGSGEGVERGWCGGRRDG